MSLRSNGCGQSKEHTSDGPNVGGLFEDRRAQIPHCWRNSAPDGLRSDLHSEDETSDLPKCPLEQSALRGRRNPQFHAIGGHLQVFSVRAAWRSGQNAAASHVAERSSSAAGRFGAGKESARHLSAARTPIDLARGQNQRHQRSPYCRQRMVPKTWTGNYRICRDGCDFADERAHGEDSRSVWDQFDGGGAGRYLSAAGHGLGRRGGLHITALCPGTSVLRGVSQRATGRLSAETGV
jgi:hypothetical protein